MFVVGEATARFTEVTKIEDSVITKSEVHPTIKVMS